MPGGGPAVYSAPSSGSAAPALSSPGGPPSASLPVDNGADARSRACTRTERDAITLLGLEPEPAPSHEYG